MYCARVVRKNQLDRSLWAGRELCQVVIRFVFGRYSQAFQNFGELVFQIIQLLQHIILAAFQFIKKLARFGVFGVRAGNWRHEGYLGPVIFFDQVTKQDTMV